MTLTTPGDARNQDVGRVLGLSRLAVAGHAGLGDVGRMIETGPRHPIRRELHGLDTPLLQAGLAGIPGDFVTIGADALLEQLAGQFA